MIKGQQIILYDTTVTGEDDFGRDIEEETPITIDNVVIGHPTSEDILSEINISGKKAVYNLCIPVGDTHDWENKVVEFYGRKWRTIGIATQADEAFVKNMGPLQQWNKQIKVETYE